MVEVSLSDEGGENQCIMTIKAVTVAPKAEVAPEPASKQPVKSTETTNTATKTENTVVSAPKVARRIKTQQESIEIQCALKAAVDVFNKIGNDISCEDAAVDMISRLTDKFVALIQA